MSNTVHFPPTFSSLSTETKEKIARFKKSIKLKISTVILHTNDNNLFVPKNLKKYNDLILNFSFSFTPNNLTYNVTGISQTLKFQEGFYHCTIPWNTIFGIVSENRRTLKFWMKSAPFHLRKKYNIFF